VITPPKKPQRLAEDASGYTLHTIGGELTDQQKRHILRDLLKDLREE
jgi:uncharacterized membrane protein